MYQEIYLMMVILLYITLIIGVIKAFEYLQADRKG